MYAVFTNLHSVHSVNDNHSCEQPVDCLYKLNAGPADAPCGLGSIVE